MLSGWRSGIAEAHSSCSTDRRCWHSGKRFLASAWRAAYVCTRCTHAHNAMRVFAQVRLCRCHVFLKPSSRVFTALSTDESTNYQCLACVNKDCKDGTYRTGTCEGTGNNFVCASQPICPKDEYLDGATTLIQGKCKACDSTVCSPGTFRTGTCSGTVSPRRTRPVNFLQLLFCIRQQASVGFLDYSM